MKQKKQDKFDFFNLIYALVLIVYLIYGLFFTDIFNSSEDIDSSNWAGQWISEEGQEVDANRVIASVGDTVTITKPLPSLINRGDSLCFISHNANVKVTIDGEEVLNFVSSKNFTGYGYGDLKQYIGLSKLDQGKEVKIEVTSSFKNKGTGYIEKIYLGNPDKYSHTLIGQKLFGAVLSMLIMFFGFFIIAMYLCTPRRHDLPYDVVAMGVSAVLMGAWCLVYTGILPILTGKVIGYRIFSYLLIQFSAYTVVCVAASFLVRKERFYKRLALVSWVFVMIVFSILRFGFNYDMHNLMYILYFSYTVSFGYMIFILMMDRRYCIKHHIEKHIRYFNFGALFVLLGAFADMFAYLDNTSPFYGKGNFVRLGLCCFIFSMMLQFLDWWSGERKAMKRSDFINNVLKQAVSSDDPETNINRMMDFVGNKLKAERAFIFEENGDGTYTNTYEWCKEGLASKSKEFANVPLDGYIGKVFQDIDSTGHAVIEDVTQLKEEDIDLYNVLYKNDVENVVAGVLEANGEFKGIFGVENIMLGDSLTDISEVVKLLSYFFGQLVIQRDNNLKLIGYGYNDLMTDVGNRRAFERFEDEELDKEGTYGFIMCDINGLKAVNDNQGHEAGDDLIKGVCQSLVDTFGKMNVFRMGGDEFVVVSHVKSEGELEAKVNLAKKFIEMEKRSASIGYVFCENGSIPYEEVKVEADKRMYQEKQLYYSGRNERRKRD